MKRGMRFLVCVMLCITLVLSAFVPASAIALVDDVAFWTGIAALTSIAVGGAMYSLDPNASNINWHAVADFLVGDVHLAVAGDYCVYDPDNAVLAIPSSIYNAVNTTLKDNQYAGFAGGVGRRFSSANNVLEFTVNGTQYAIKNQSSKAGYYFINSYGLPVSSVVSGGSTYYTFIPNYLSNVQANLFDVAYTDWVTPDLYFLPVTATTRSRVDMITNNGSVPVHTVLGSSPLVGNYVTSGSKVVYVYSLNDNTLPEMKNDNASIIDISLIARQQNKPPVQDDPDRLVYTGRHNDGVNGDGVATNAGEPVYTEKSTVTNVNEPYVQINLNGFADGGIVLPDDLNEFLANVSAGLTSVQGASTIDDYITSAPISTDTFEELASSPTAQKIDLNNPSATPDGGLFNWLKKIYEAIISFATNVASALSSILKAITDGGFVDSVIGFVDTVKTGASSIWHYVVTWVGSLGSSLSVFVSVWSNLPYAMVVPVYATAVIVIVLSIFKRLF